MPRRYRKGQTPLNSLCRYEEGEVTADQVRIARERTAIHLRNIHMVDYSLTHLLVDVYMQGCRDMAEAVIVNPASVFPTEPWPEDDGFDYQRGSE